MPSYAVETAPRAYAVVVERGGLQRLGELIPAGFGRVFVITTRDVWLLHGAPVARALDGRSHAVLFFPGSEPRKRLSEVEMLAEQMAADGADRSSLVVALGGGILTDVAGFLAAIFMRGIPVIQIPTTLVAQVDAAVGGKTGVNLAAGKNLIGSFHQPLAVLIDPLVLDTLPEREYRAGLCEVIKHGVIADPDLFQVMYRDRDRVLARDPETVDRMISDSVRIKAAVVSGDEKENDLRRVLNFGHTFGHALEAETAYSRFLHGEAVAWGMKAAATLARMVGMLKPDGERRIIDCIDGYGPWPSLAGVDTARLAARLRGDKKTIQGRVHFVLPDRIGHVVVRADIGGDLALTAIEQTA